MSKANHAWVFLRGLSREKQHWGDFPDVFAQHFNTNVICIDMPGVGEHYQQKAPTHIRAWVNHLENQLQKKAPAVQSVSVFAYSMGAMVANYWIKHTSLNVEQMVWINTSFSNLSPLHHRMQWPVLRSLPKFFLHFASPSKREAWVLRWTVSSEQGYTDVLNNWINIQNERPVSFLNFFRHALLASNLRLLQKPTCPLLVLQSLQDKLVAPQCSQSIVDKFQCAHESHPDSGHDVVLEDPHWVIQQVEKNLV